MRLDKYIAECLNVSRKDSKIIIKKKQITINNQIVTKEDYNVNIEQDRVYALDKLLKYEKNIYLVMHKPRGYLSARVDNLHKTVMELVPKEYLIKDLTIVGRLDIDTEGVLLLTNDGILVHNLTSPNHSVEKTYYCEFEGTLPDNAIELVAYGLEIDDYVTKPATLVLKSVSSAEIIITEGKYHQVKKMFQKLGTKITYLKRIKFDTITVDDLEIGKIRKLTEEEVKTLKGK